MLRHENYCYKWKQKRIFYQISSETPCIVTGLQPQVAAFDISPHGLERKEQHAYEFFW
jgi:hypothetical protein